MPGPCNSKKTRSGKKHKRTTRVLVDRVNNSAAQSGSAPLTLSTPNPTVAFNAVGTAPVPYSAPIEPPLQFVSESPRKLTECRPPEGTPYIYIHDPGNGPRVRDTRAFLSSYFAHPPSLDDPLCAEFAQEEVLQMLMTVLPKDIALVLWYNKSRATGRICPACRRLYCLGDTLPQHFTDGDASEDEFGSALQQPAPQPQLAREQQISGLCSPLCFLLASLFNPFVMRSTWGRTADEITDEAWTELDTPRAYDEGKDGKGNGDVLGLGLLLKMTRLPDLGLAQLCLPEVDFEQLLEEDQDDNRGLERLTQGE